MANSTPAIGIDLGTTYSACAVFRDGDTQIVPNALGELLTPSVVGVDDDGTILIGRAARERLISHPAFTTAFFKRIMGTGAQVILGGKRRQEFSAIELSSLVLRSLKEDAERLLGEPVSQAVVSVPAYFNHAQRQATREAGELAGLTVNRLVNEPTAAAIAYGLNKSREGNFIVLDFGGGTFDCTILEYFHGVLEVHATAGDSALGGEDFTEALVSRFKQTHSLDALSAVDQQRLYARMETAKRSLRSGETTNVQFAAADRSYESDVTENYLSTAAAALLIRLRSAMERALLDADLSSDDIQEVVLVGGSARLGVFRALVTKLFGRFPRMDAEPDLTVARGAALQAALAARDEALEDVVLTDVCPFSLGIAAATAPQGPPSFVPILERNTTVPASRVRRFPRSPQTAHGVDPNISGREPRLRPQPPARQARGACAAGTGKGAEHRLTLQLRRSTASSRWMSRS